MSARLSASTRIRLAEAAMGGDEAARARLAEAGLAHDTIAALYATMADAHAELSPTEQVADEARLTRELDALTSGRGLA